MNPNIIIMVNLGSIEEIGVDIHKSGIDLVHEPPTWDEETDCDRPLHTYEFSQCERVIAYKKRVYDIIHGGYNLYRDSKPNYAGEVIDGKLIYGELVRDDTTKFLGKEFYTFIKENFECPKFFTYENFM